jgi:hypothetical protein
VNSLFCYFTNPALKRGWLLLLGAALAGCGRDDIQVYRVAKEQPQAQQPQEQAQGAALPTGHSDFSAAPPGIKYKLPAGWEETAPGQMRVASFHVQGKDGKQADVGVVPLPGLMGGDVEIVNRWRSTVGLPAVKEEELPKLAQPIEIAGETGQLYDQGGENPGSGDKSRILAAVLRREGVAWFFKMNGDDELVAHQKPTFLDFLKSVNFVAGSMRTDLPPSHPPIGDLSSMPMLSAGAAPSSSEGKPSWQVPDGWKEVPGGGFLVAKFVITGADSSQAAVNVSMSSGSGGGLAMNVNRWRGQLGLSSLSEDDLNKSVTSMETAQGKAMLVDVAGVDARTNQKARLIGVIVPQANRTWFYKLMGNEQVVEKERDAFSKFVQTAKYPNAA